MKKFLFIGFLIYSYNCFAQIDRTFWFAVPKETDGYGYFNAVNTISFKITAMDLDATVTVSMPLNDIPAGTFNPNKYGPQTFTVPAHQSYVYTIAEGWNDFYTFYNNTALIGTRAVSDQPGLPENRGFLITSDNDITVFYDYDNYWNRELFSLKGQNALGTEFYTPFQNIWGADNNNQGTLNPKPYCSIEIVATVDNTQVTITPPALAVTVFNGYPNNNPIPVTLNRGQSFSLVANYDTSYYHPTGTHIVSNKPIAVTQNDDAEAIKGNSSYDINGDQLVPVSILGSEYLVMSGTLSVNPTPSVPHNIQKGEQVFVLATDQTTTTTVSFYGKDGTLLYTTAPLNAGQEDYYSIDIGVPNQTSVYIKTNGPKIYVWHITSDNFDIGGAVLPPITNCTGSTEVGFYRSGTVNDIQINLMIPYDTLQPYNSPTQSFNYFTLNYSDGSPSFPIPGSWFEANVKSGWAVLQFNNRNFDAITHAGQAQSISTTLCGTGNFFHLGLINGSNGLANKYGYFSNFNIQPGSARFGSTSDSSITACLGDTVILSAEGGLCYNWSYGKKGGPPTYISNPSIANPHVFPPVGNNNFYVDIHRSACFGDTTIHLKVNILPPVTAAFETNQTVGCAPANIQFTDQSINAINYFWSYKQSGQPVVNFTPPNPKSFAMTLNNDTLPYDTIIYAYTLKVDNNQGCSDSATKKITIYPEIIASMAVSDSLGCNPLTVNFKANGSSGDTLNWEWEFGDKGSSKITNPNHTYVDFSPDNKDTIYHAQLVATSPYYCTDTVRQNIHVYPYIKAGFTVDTVTACSPFIVQVNNTSSGAISLYNWDFGDGSGSNTNAGQFTHTYTNITNNIIVYYFKLTVNNKFGCNDTLTRFITVYPQAKAGFTTNITQGCNPLTVTFTNSSNLVATKFLWDFGDGSTSDNQNVTHQYLNTSDTDNVFNANLTVLTNNNCISFDSTLITVHPYINPSFTLSSSSGGCTPFTDTITNKSTGGIKKTPSPSGYTWDFGDGTISNVSAPALTHAYKNNTNNEINTTVTLTLTDISGTCTATLSRNITLYPEISANYSANNYNGCNPLTVDFTNLSSPVPVAVNFIWDFNDGSTSVMQNPTHVFNNTGKNDIIYQVKMTAISEYNCKDSVTQPITVYPYLSAEDAINKPTGCSPDTVTITNGSMGGIKQYIWNYGDGTGDNNADSSFKHIYTNKTNAPVTYNLSLIVENHIPACQDTIIRSLIVYPEVVSDFTTQGNINGGCDSVTINFINTSGPAQVPTHYDWDFGDGGSSDETKVSHMFVHPDPSSTLQKVYTTRLYAYSQYNCYSIDSTLITVDPFVKADFSIDQPDGCSPLTITFTDTSSPGANEFHWVYDNGTVNNDPAHTITQSFQNQAGGVLTVNPSLTVTYNGNCPSTMTKSIQVYSQVTANFTGDTLKGCHPLTIDFTNTSQFAQRYDWYFGDLGTSIFKNPSHIFTDYSNADSIYNVTLVATSEFNCTNSITKQVTVYPKPKALFNVQNSISCPPFQLSINNLTQAGNSYLWNFGDGTDTTTLNLSNFNHTYNNLTSNNASYLLVLGVTTNFNCTDSASQKINVYPGVISGFEPDTANCSTVLVKFRNLTQRGSTYLWNFGDGVTSNLTEPVHDFFNLGVEDTTFTVKLVSYSGFGCVDSSSRKVTVYPQPVAAFSALPLKLDFPASTVNIVNETNTGNWNYFWNFKDGTTETVSNPSGHTYVTWGQYNIELKVWSNNCSDSAFKLITVVPPVPIAAFDMSSNVCLGLAINFTDQSTWATQWNWNFGDSLTSDVENPSHIYKYPGLHLVQLTVTGDGGSDALSQEVEVYPLPKVQFTINDTVVELPSTYASSPAQVSFYNSCKLGVQYFWNFGDSITSAETNPVHDYQFPGEKTVSLKVWTEYNCIDSLIKVNAVDVISGGKIIFPNVFVPSTTGPNGGKYDPTVKTVDNSIFRPVSQDVIEYNLEIYDRWGEKLFQTNDLTIGWDGYYNEKLCKGDVYVWIAKGKFMNGQAFNLAGNVTLLK